MLRGLVWSDARRRKTEHFLDLLRSILLTATENIGLLALTIAYLMNGHVGTKGEEAHQRIRGKQRQTNHKSVLESM